MEIDEIKQCLPHREPFLLVDKVISYDPGVRLTAEKEVRRDDFWVPAHFPNRPIMPGVLMVEALAQACGLLMSVSAATKDKTTTPIYFLAGIDNARFKRIIEPNSVIRLEVSLLKHRSPIVKFHGEVFVKTELACSCDLMISSKREEKHDPS